MTQVSWLSDTSTLFRFYQEADSSLISYLQNSAPNSITSVLSSLTIRRTVLEEPNEDNSKSGFPIVHLWTEAAEDQYLTPQSPMPTSTSRFLVWDLDTDVDVMIRGVQEVCGAIASALQQTQESSANDWKDFYLSWREGNEPLIQISNIRMDGEWARGEVRCIWTHYE